MLTRRTASVLTLLAGFSISACSAFFVPNRDDDDVQRCNTSEDCDDLGDNRYTPQCIYGEGQPENSSKVCVADFAEVACDGAKFDADSTFRMKFDDATSNQNKIRYVGCRMEFLGQQGCAPNGTSCEAGLSLNENGLCDDPDAPMPAIDPSDYENEAILGKDVNDQFCQYYFCDETFVCAPSGAKKLCKPCDPDRPYDEGGCGTMYLQGAKSSVYTDASAGNCNGDKEKDEVEFGDVTVP